MARENHRAFQERERLANIAITKIVRELKKGASIKDLQSSGLYTDRQIDRAYDKFRKGSCKGSRGGDPLKCKCGLATNWLNVFGECRVCETRRIAGVRC